MNLGDPWTFTSAMLISCLGMGFYFYGKRTAKPWPQVAGMALGTYPFFLSAIWLMWVIAAAIIAALFLLRER